MGSTQWRYFLGAKGIYRILQSSRIPIFANINYNLKEDLVMNGKKNIVVIEIEAFDSAERLHRIQVGLLDLVMGTLMAGSESEDLVVDRGMSNGMIEALSLVQATLGQEHQEERTSLACIHAHSIFDLMSNPLEGIEEAALWPVLPN
jgi:hypothetical protein